jgi:hypothetical protein
LSRESSSGSSKMSTKSTNWIKKALGTLKQKTKLVTNEVYLKKFHIKRNNI